MLMPSRTCTDQRPMQLDTFRKRREAPEGLLPLVAAEIVGSAPLRPGV
jgi:hypothetical protein